MHICKLVENNNKMFDLQLLWELEMKELNLANANLAGATALSPVDLELMKQRGAITELKGEEEDVEEGKTRPSHMNKRINIVCFFS
jgi:hypothetical protein